MTSLSQKAEESDVQFVAASDLNPGSIWRVQARGLEMAENIGTDDFPQHGDWLEASQGGRVTYWLECPAGLASSLMAALEERGLDEDDLLGYWFRVADRRRARPDDENAPWQFDVELATADVETREEAVEALLNE